MMKGAKTGHRNQEGFAAIVIAMVLVLVLTLLTVGFGDLMRRETRSALDKQLASQAYYAAESGVNDAAAVISNNPTVRKSTCGPTPAGPGSLFPDNRVGTSTGASYPCLLINPTPLTLDYTVGTEEAKVTQLQGVDSSGTPKAVGFMIISWEETGGATSFAPAGNCNGGTINTFPPVSGGPSSWPYTGLLRLQLTPMSDLSRNGLLTNTYTAFMCPRAGGGTPTTSAYTSNRDTSGGGVVSGNCNAAATPRHCSVRIDGLAALNESTFFLNMRSIYSPTNVTIRLFGADVANTQLNIGQAQILVDSTGKAQDVVKRIQVRIPAHNSYATPDSTAAMNSICKQLQVMPAIVAASTRGGGVDCTP